MTFNPLAEDFAPAAAAATEPTHHAPPAAFHPPQEVTPRPVECFIPLQLYMQLSPMHASKQGFLNHFYPGYPKNYMKEIVEPALANEIVPHLTPQTFDTVASLHKMIQGRENAAMVLTYKISEQRTKMYASGEPRTVTFKEVNDLKEAMSRRQDPHSGVHVPMSPLAYGYHAFVFHTIFMTEGDLTKLVSDVRAVVAVKGGQLHV